MVRGEPPLSEPALCAPAVARPPAESWHLGQQPCHRRVGRPVHGGLRVSHLSRIVSVDGAGGRGLVAEAKRQIDGDGVDRELSADYHGFVAELFMLAGLEGEAAGSGLGDEFWVRVRSMVDVVAAMLDVSGRPPRQGDSDDAIALLLDGAGFDRWASLLATGSALFGRLDWWPTPRVVGDVRSSALAAFASRRRIARWSTLRPAGVIPGVRDDDPEGTARWAVRDLVSL